MYADIGTASDKTIQLGSLVAVQVNKMIGAERWFSCNSNDWASVNWLAGCLANVDTSSGKPIDVDVIEPRVALSGNDLRVCSGIVSDDS